MDESSWGFSEGHCFSEGVWKECLVMQVLKAECRSQMAVGLQAGHMLRRSSCHHSAAEGGSDGDYPHHPQCQ